MLFNEIEFKRMIAEGVAESLAAIIKQREYLTVPEVCSELRCSRSMIDKQIRENGLPITRVDGKIIIRREHLYEWLDKRVECNDWNRTIERVK